jgi:hypothetical protein
VNESKLAECGRRFHEWLEIYRHVFNRDLDEMHLVILHSAIQLDVYGYGVLHDHYHAEHGEEP